MRDLPFDSGMSLDSTESRSSNAAEPRQAFAPVSALGTGLAYGFAVAVLCAMPVVVLAVSSRARPSSEAIDL
jgi:hypothetical protein